MLAAMSEKQKKSNLSQKIPSKNATVKGRSKSQSTPTPKKTRSTATRKKRQNKIVIASLILFCILLIGFNLFLVIKLLSIEKNTPLSGDTASKSYQSEEHAPPPERQHTEHQKEETNPSDSSLTANTIPTITPHAAKPEHSGKEVMDSEMTKPPAEYTDTTAVHGKIKNTEAQKLPQVAPEQTSPETAGKTAERTHVTAPPPPSLSANAKTGPAQHSIQKPSIPPDNSVLPQKELAPRAKQEQPKKHASHVGTLIFVFDDAGHNLAQLEHFLHLPFPCTIAVLPGLRYSSESARRIRTAGK